MNIFKQEFKSNLRSTITWTISIALVVFLVMALFPGFNKDAQQMEDLMLGFPEPLREALQLNIDVFRSVLGFYSFTFLYILLIGSIQALNLGLSMLSKEQREKTADFLLTKPVTRVKIVTAKLQAALTSLIFTNIVYIIISYISIEMVKNTDYSIKKFLMMALTLFFVQVLFLSLGFILSVLIPKIKSVISISLPTVFGFFIIRMLGSIIGEKEVRYITPLEYYDRQYILTEGRYETQFFIIEIILMVIFISATYFIYHKKDIHSI